ncbi:MAG TPA: osmoprotectant transporter permease [Candidatus Eisenbacteria bacterium]|nr:osmoprotectant transporter permease [Candidatus Eisenbacteria bacterium]
MKAFWFLWTIDALVALVFLYFFFVGLADGSVSSFNIGLWSVVLVALAGIVLGSLHLRSAGRIGPAIKLLGLLAVPAIGVGLLFLAVLITHPRWN